ncbi:hypothetical protein [Paenibacillus sp. NPDC058174]|uniref:hypothetical protein n=1 Tax=Paenibacillus sp. NPDC058174 TaxID=3346366 RepID=UPI0036D78105
MNFDFFLEVFKDRLPVIESYPHTKILYSELEVSFLKADANKIVIDTNELTFTVESSKRVADHLDDDFFMDHYAISSLSRLIIVSDVKYKSIETKQLNIIFNLMLTYFHVIFVDHNHGLEPGEISCMYYGKLDIADHSFDVFCDPSTL